MNKGDTMQINPTYGNIVMFILAYESINNNYIIENEWPNQ